MTRDERLLAYVDGQLEPADRAAFEAEIAADPDLAASVARHRALSGRISAAYAPVLDEAVPPGLTALALAANDRAPARFGIPQWAAMAACLVAGVLVSRTVWPTGGALVARDGALVAQGGLAKALTTQLSAQAGPVRVGLSFRDAAGSYCRTFQSTPDRMAGVACREDDRWVARTASAWTPTAGPDYRMAGSETPPEVLATVDRLIVGDPLDAAAERAARQRGWSPQPSRP